MLLSSLLAVVSSWKSSTHLDDSVLANEHHPSPLAILDVIAPVPVSFSAASSNANIMDSKSHDFPMVKGFVSTPGSEKKSKPWQTQEKPVQSQNQIECNNANYDVFSYMSTTYLSLNNANNNNNNKDQTAAKKSKTNIQTFNATVLRSCKTLGTSLSTQFEYTMFLRHVSLSSGAGSGSVSVLHAKMDLEAYAFKYIRDSDGKITSVLVDAKDSVDSINIKKGIAEVNSHISCLFNPVNLFDI
jgi:hypothetical protein